MLDQSKLFVREIEERDIPLITSYWLGSEPKFLKGMGADINKLPSRAQFDGMLKKQISLAIDQKPSFALIWENNGQAIGHCNVNKIEFGKSAFMYLHLWKSEHRQKGMGSHLVQKSLEIFFKRLELQEIYSEPYGLNPGPNKTLRNLGFEFVKRYTTIPGSLNFEQEVNRWKLDRIQQENHYSN